jgi:CP family cyanate transporter-like MFS transporter
VAFNLRPALAGIGPLVDAIQADTGLSSSALGALTTLPLVAFGFLSLLAAPVARGMGLERAIALGLVLIGAGTALRGVHGVAFLYLGTGVLGVGVALGNVLLPAMAKLRFPHSPGPVTSLYSSMMGVGAALAAGVSVPLADRVGWELSLGLWAIPAGVALVVWLPALRSNTERAGSERRAGQLGHLIRSPVAWQVALYMGLQSLSFYVLLAWLPALLQSQGMTEAGAGGLLALSQVTGIVGSAMIPVWAGGLRSQRVIVWTLGALEAAGLAGLALTGGVWLTLSVGLLGFVLGGTFALALTFLVLRSDDVASAASLSGMAQSIGYLLAAVGPPAIGAIHDARGGWGFMVVALAGVLALKVAAGIPASRGS